MVRAAVLGLLLATLVAVAVPWPAPPPAAPRDVVVLADNPPNPPFAALAFGSSLTLRAKWPAGIARALADCGIPIDVTVVARPGHGSPDAGRQLDAAPGEAFHLAFVEFAINDADLLDGVSRATSLANHRAFLAAVRDRYPGIAVVLITTNPVSGLQRLKRPTLRSYYDLYPILAAEAGASLFDGVSRWSLAAGRKGALPDGLHPDPQVEADLYKAPLAGLVARVFGRHCAP